MALALVAGDRSETAQRQGGWPERLQRAANRWPADEAKRDPQRQEATEPLRSKHRPEQLRRPNHAQLRLRIAGPACPHQPTWQRGSPCMCLQHSTAQPRRGNPTPNWLNCRGSQWVEHTNEHGTDGLTPCSQLQPAGSLRHHPAAGLRSQGQGDWLQLRPPSLGLLLHRRPLQGLQ